MGHVDSHKKLVRFNTTKSGDLVEFELHEEAATGIVLERNKDEDLVIGLITNYLELPLTTTARQDEFCISYGNNWSIEPLQALSLNPRTPDVKRRAGLLALSVNGWSINFATSNPDGFGRFNWNWWDLNSFERYNADKDKVVLYDSWNLWSPTEHRDLVGTKPMIHFIATPFSAR